MDPAKIAHEIMMKVMERCIERRMAAPWIITAISPNGDLLSVRMNPPGDPDVLIERSESGEFRIPMTIIVVDQYNEVLQTTLDDRGRITWK
jgi:hypothetical protein